MKETLLFTERMTSAMTEIQAHEGSIIHVFGNQAMVVHLPDSVAPGALAHSSVKQPKDLDETVLLLINGWRDAKAMRSTNSKVDGEGLAWDTAGREGP
jgi:hypothetical protein